MPAVTLLFLLALGLVNARLADNSGPGGAPAMMEALALQRGKETFYLYRENQTLCLLSPEGDLAGSYHPGTGRVVLSWCISDLDRDGDDKVLLITGGDNRAYDHILTGDTLIILDFDGYFREIFNQSFNVLNPWKVQTADVDGDGIIEISLGVYKEAPFHPVMAKRPFIYSWQENGLVPKWQGSRLSRPFEDYIFADLDGSGGDELIASELLENGGKVLQAYSWKGFGFEGVGQSPTFTDIQGICKIRLAHAWAVQALVTEGDNISLAIFKFDGSQLIKDQ